MPPMEDIFIDLNIITWMALIAACLMVIGIVFDTTYVFWYYVKKKKKKKKNYTIKTEMLTGFGSRETINEDLTRWNNPSPRDDGSSKIAEQRTYEFVVRNGKIIGDGGGGHRENEELMLVPKRQFKELEIELGELKQALMKIVQMIEQEK